MNEIMNGTFKNKMKELNKYKLYAGINDIFILYILIEISY